MNLPNVAKCMFQYFQYLIVRATSSNEDDPEDDFGDDDGDNFGDCDGEVMMVECHCGRAAAL